jgi:4-hydroxy-4-methyl-2-oxoglutarate aldolase
MSGERAILGRMPGVVRRPALDPVPPDVLAGFRALADLTPTVSDVLDELGLAGAIPATELHAAAPGARVVGRALTVRNVPRRESVAAAVATGRNTMGDTEAYQLAEPGDVVVVEGLNGVSNMGGQGIQVAHRQGCVGAVIDGSFRDPDMPAALGFGLWSRGPTPVTGKWRLETVEVNGRVRIVGIEVDAGDLVVADDGGVCIVPAGRAADVLARAEEIDAGDRRRKADIESGLDIATLMEHRYR